MYVCIYIKCTPFGLRMWQACTRSVYVVSKLRLSSQEGVVPVKTMRGLGCLALAGLAAFVLVLSLSITDAEFSTHSMLASGTGPQQGRGMARSHLSVGQKSSPSLTLRSAQHEDLSSPPLRKHDAASSCSKDVSSSIASGSRISYTHEDNLFEGLLGDVRVQRLRGGGRGKPAKKAQEEVGFEPVVCQL